MKPLLVALKQILYRWRFRFGISASKQGHTFLLRSPEELEDFYFNLVLTRIELPDWFNEYWIPEALVWLREDSNQP